MANRNVTLDAILPISKAGLRLWHDFSNAKYLNLASTAIVQALDRSGNNAHTAVQGTGTSRPTWTASQLNGLPTAVFDGGDVLLGSARLHNICNGANTVFVVAKRTTEAATQNSMMAIYRSGVATGLRVDFSATAGTINYQTSDVSPVASTGNTNTNYNIITGRRSGATHGISINHNTEVTAATAISSSVAASFDIGMQNGSLLLTGGMGEIIIYDRKLSNTEILQVEIYLADKWGIYHPNAMWINTYSTWQQMLIHAWKINKDNAFTNTTANPFAAIYDPSAAALGSTTSLADTGRGVNTATEATNPPVNTAAAIGSANGLLYNGTTTILNAGSGSTVDDIFAAGGCFIGVINPTTTGESSLGCIFEKGAIVLRVESASGGKYYNAFYQTFSVTNGGWYDTTRTATLGAANIIAITYDSSNFANNPSFYLNSLTPKTTTASSVPVGTANSDGGSSLILGNNVSVTGTTDGYIGKMVFLKSVPTTAQLTSVFNFLATEYGVTLT